MVRSALAESTRPEQLYIRVKRSIKILYTLLSGEQKKLLRDMLENAVVRFFTNKQLFEQKSVVVNINVQQIVKNEDYARDVNIVKLKRELDKLREELARATAENVELKNELEKMRKRCDELQRQLQHSQQHQSVSFKYRDAVFALLVVKACIEKYSCDAAKLLEFLSNELARHRTVQISESFIESYVKQLVK